MKLTPTIHSDLELSDRQRNVLRRLGFDRLPAMCGADGEGGGGGGGAAGGGSGGGGEGGGSGSGEGGNGGGNGGGSGSGSGNGGAGGEGGFTPPDQGTWNDVQRQLRESRQQAADLQKAADDRARKEAEDQGQFKELAEKEKARADGLEQRIAKMEREGRVEKIAKRLNFIDPTDVMHRLSEDDLADDAKVEKALKALAEQKKYLVTGGGAAQTRDVTGDGGGGGEGGSGGGGGGNGSGSSVGVGRLAAAYGDRGTSG